jgi:hypothetical protein
MVNYRKYNIKIGLEIQCVKIGNWIRPVEHGSPKHGSGPSPVDCEVKVKICPCTQLESM